MKSNSDNLDQERFYEITEVTKDNVWFAEPGTPYCCLGAILQPTELPGSFRIIKSSPTGYLGVSTEPDDALFMGRKVTLRPLNKKDQAKLQRVRDQFS